MHQFDGYVDKEATQNKIIHDVFVKGDSVFRSGDILVQDKEGYYYFQDRTGDTFRWKGENVGTAEVEAIISRILNMMDVVVYGVKIPGIINSTVILRILSAIGRDTLSLKIASIMFFCSIDFSKYFLV